MRVIIVGGGIAGLTFASALEKAGIDYVLLESRGIFDPQVGASIAIQASGMRILDQLGAADEIIGQTVPIHHTRQRRSDGSLIAKPSVSFALTKKRFGYGTMFLDRQLVLRALDRTIASRPQMLPNKTVRSVEHDDAGATVHCDDGSSYRGDIVVGCEGVNSKASVRSEMLRLAAEREPNYFPKAEETKMTATYSCLFGISTDIEGLVAGDLDVTYDVERSFLVIAGTGNRVFWFFFQKLDKTYTYGAEDYPRYSKADAERVAVENAWRPCHGSLTLGDLWAKRLSYTLVPMEEALFSQWSWGRIATIGDSAHKMTANHGQAGNNAIESAAALANHLKRLHDSPGTVTQDAITTAFRQWKEKRRIRIEATVKEAAKICRMQALDNTMAKLTVFGLLPYMDEYTPSLVVDVTIGAEVLEYLPIPEKSLSGTCPFNPTYGVGQHESAWKRAALAAPLLVIAYWIADQTSLQGVASSMVPHLVPPPPPAAAAAAAPDAAHQWSQTFSAHVDATLIYALWLIESSRRANAFTIIQFPLIFGLLAHLFGPGVAAPCFYFFHYTFGKLENFACADQRLTDMAYTRTVLPLALLGMCAPLLLRITGPPLDLNTLHISATQCRILWAFLPPLAISLTQRALVVAGISKSNVFQDALTNWNRDLPTLRRTVYVLGAVSTAAWGYALSCGGLLLQFPTMTTITTPLQWNQFGIMLSSALWLGLLLADLRKAGMADRIDTVRIAICAGFAGFSAAAGGGGGGPAAVIACGWLLREEILATKQEKNAVTKERYMGKSVDDVVRAARGVDIFGTGRGGGEKRIEVR